MAININGGSDYYLNNLQSSKQTASAEKLQSTLNGIGSSSSDDDMMTACKEFEAYLVEQMLKGMEKTIPKNDDEKENDYLAHFGDMMYENVAEQIADNGELGLAQQLYESMKRNQGL